ncbi:MAG: formylglycine-generating enzyme family protein [Candidatus Schekmanbacteria bacterium]|nr:formylglycine-generating enzyme family protein [Candidatus Schekmanbacteria bacterium]
MFYNSIIFLLLLIIYPLTGWAQEMPSNMVSIPAGSFIMGSKLGDKDEIPEHEVYVKAFYIDKYEVTNVQFKRFIEVNPEWSKEKINPKLHDGDYLKHWERGNYPAGMDNHPVVYVSWFAADAYARWAKKELPSEVQWEKAAGLNLLNEKMEKNYKYKWGVGNIFDPYLANTAHYHGFPLGGYWSDWWADFKQDLPQKFASGGITSPVGHFPAGVNNLYDMTGNVWEWCQDWYQGDSYARNKMSVKRSSKEEEAEGRRFDRLYEPSSIKDSGSASGNYRVVRGCSWADGDGICRTANRYKFRPEFSSDEVGFRCVKPVGN